MILQKLKEKFIILSKLLKLIYGRYTASAIWRDVLFVLSTFAEIYGITIFGKFVDETTDLLLHWGEFDLGAYFATESFLYLVIILALWIVVQVCTEVRSFFYNVIYERMWEDTQHMVITKVSSSNLEDVEKEEYQDLVTFVGSFSLSRMSLAYENFSTVLSNTIRLISAGVILFNTMHWSVFLLLLFIIPETVAIYLRRREMREYQDNEVGKIKFLNYLQNLSLTISNFNELRVNDVYSHIKRKYREEYDEYLNGFLKTHLNFTQDKVLYSIIGQAMKFGYIVYLLAYSIMKKLSFGTFKALYDYVDVVYTSIFNINDSLSLMSNNLGYIKGFFELIEYQGFGDYSHGDVILDDKTPVLEFNHMGFSYPDDPETKVLKDISLKIDPGEKVAFFGGDGSGKSTMVKILTGLYRVNVGKFLIDGNNVKDLDRGQLKKKISVTFQDYINYHFSLKENIVISGQRKNVEKDLYEEVSDISGVNIFKKNSKLEDTTILGKTFPLGKELSPGYWQRLGIARMLYRNRKIFVLDEPFTYIDDISADTILHNIFSFVGKERSLIYITRSVNLLKYFDRIYIFDKGKIVDSGSFSELKKKGILKE